jgi:hypothetical protein
MPSKRSSNASAPPSKPRSADRHAPAFGFVGMSGQERQLPARGLTYSLAGAATLAALTLLMPLLGTAADLTPAVRISAYALVFAPVALLLHGSIVASLGFATSRLLLLGAASAAIGLLSALFARPEALADRPGFLILLALCVADLARILAAACVGISLARYITSVGTVLIVVVAAIAADIFSVFAGPTEALVRTDSPLLDLLLLIFPTFGSPLGFGLGLSDFIFLALFAAAARSLDLRYATTLPSVCAAAFLAVTAGLLLARPLPALPFIALAFVVGNADLIVASLLSRR